MSSYSSRALGETDNNDSCVTGRLWASTGRESGADRENHLQRTAWVSERSVCVCGGGSLNILEPIFSWWVNLQVKWHSGVGGTPVPKPTHLFTWRQKGRAGISEPILQILPC